MNSGDMELEADVTGRYVHEARTYDIVTNGDDTKAKRMEWAYKTGARESVLRALDVESSREAEPADLTIFCFNIRHLFVNACASGGRLVDFQSYALTPPHALALTRTRQILA